uniref:Uncharacterized protein n=1 Tax=Ascaris lumbricoides TaxID=6252 RepID=A0A0M3IG59_ASCLU
MKKSQMRFGDEQLRQLSVTRKQYWIILNVVYIMHSADKMPQSCGIHLREIPVASHNIRVVLVSEAAEWLSGYIMKELLEAYVELDR